MNAYLTERSDLLQQFWSIRNIICILKNCLHTFHVFTWEAKYRDIFYFLCLPLTCLFQNKTKINEKTDENWALLPHSATSSVPTPFASLSSSFCSMSLWAHLLFEQVWGGSISAEHHWASAVLHHCSCWLCHQPRVSCMCCMHPHTHALKAERVEMPPAPTATWAAWGEGQREETSAVKSWWIHLSLLNEIIPHGFADRANAAVALLSRRNSKFTWGADFRMPQTSAQAGVWAWAQGHRRFLLSFADIAVGGIEQPQLFQRCCSSPLQLLACLTCSVCCEQRIHKFSHPHHETQSGKKVYREKTPTYFYFWKVTFAFTTIMQIFTY